MHILYRYTHVATNQLINVCAHKHMCAYMYIDTLGLAIGYASIW